VTGWCDGLAGWYASGVLPVYLFPYGDCFRYIIWPALRLYLPFMAVAALALWGVRLVFGKKD
jgi:hypothetical protein